MVNSAHLLSLSRWLDSTAYCFEETTHRDSQPTYSSRCSSEYSRSGRFPLLTILFQDRKNDLILIMTPEKQDKTLELRKHWSVDSTSARNEVIMKRTYPVKSVKCDKICSNY